MEWVRKDGTIMDVGYYFCTGKGGGGRGRWGSTLRD